MEKSIVYNKKFALGLTALICLLVFLFGGARALNAEKNKILLIFENGVDNDGFSVSKDIRKKAESAYNMAVIAQKNGLGEDADKLLTAANKVLSEKNADDKILASKELDIVEVMVYNGLEVKAKSVLDEQNLKYWETAHAEIISRQNTMSLDPYFAKAKEFNRELNKFPAIIIKFVRLVQELLVL